MQQRASQEPHATGSPRWRLGGMNQGMRVLSYLIAGVAVYGAWAGWVTGSWARLSCCRSASWSAPAWAST